MIWSLIVWWLLGFLAFLGIYVWYAGTRNGYGWNDNYMRDAYESFWIAALLWPISVIGLIITVCVSPILNWIHDKGYRYAKRRTDDKD